MLNYENIIVAFVGNCVVLGFCIYPGIKEEMEIAARGRNWGEVRSIITLTIFSMIFALGFSMILSYDSAPERIPQRITIVSLLLSVARVGGCTLLMLVPLALTASIVRIHQESNKYILGLVIAICGFGSWFISWISIGIWWLCKLPLM